MATLNDNYVYQFAKLIYQMAQQQTSRLRQHVVSVDMTGERMFFERVHPTAMEAVTSRFTPSPVMETEFTRRALDIIDYHIGDMIDWKDDPRLLISPESAIVSAFAMAFGRQVDETIIQDCFMAASKEGRAGATVVPFPTSQIVPVNTGGSNSGMNLAKLIEAKSLFGRNDLDDSMPGNEIMLGISQRQLDDLLKDEKLTSADFANVKALNEGVINRFMGMTFIRTELFQKTAGVRTCVAWMKSGVRLAMPQAWTMKVAERHDVSFNWYAFGKLTIGGCRIEDEKVVHIPCNEA